MSTAKEMSGREDQFYFAFQEQTPTGGEARPTLIGRVPTTPAQAAVPSRAAGGTTAKYPKELKVCPKCRDPHSVRVKIYGRVKRVEYCVNGGCSYLRPLPNLRMEVRSGWRPL